MMRNQDDSARKVANSGVSAGLMADRLKTRRTTINPESHA